MCSPSFSFSWLSIENLGRGAAASRRHRVLCTFSESKIETPYPRPSGVSECGSFASEEAESG